MTLFAGLFFLAVRFVHTYPIPMTVSQLDSWFALSEKFGIRDPEDLWLFVMLVVDLIVAIIAYVVIMKLWNIYEERHRKNLGLPS
jgi:hypothetical protein